MNDYNWYKKARSNPEPAKWGNHKNPTNVTTTYYKNRLRNGLTEFQISFSGLCSTGPKNRSQSLKLAGTCRIKSTAINYFVV